MVIMVTIGCSHVLHWWTCRFNLKKLTYDERKARLIERLNALNAAAGRDEDDDDDEDDE